MSELISCLWLSVYLYFTLRIQFKVKLDFSRLRLTSRRFWQLRQICSCVWRFKLSQRSLVKIRMLKYDRCRLWTALCVSPVSTCGGSWLRSLSLKQLLLHRAAAAGVKQTLNSFITRVSGGHQWEASRFLWWESKAGTSPQSQIRRISIRQSWGQDTVQTGIQRTDCWEVRL